MRSFVELKTGDLFHDEFDNLVLGLFEDTEKGLVLCCLVEIFLSLDMKVEVEFLMWLAQNNPDCLNLHGNDEDFGRHKFERLYKKFLEWRQLPEAETKALKIMQDHDDLLAVTDYNTGFLNGMETILAVYQERDANLISLKNLKRPGEALKMKQSEKTGQKMGL